MPLSLSEAKNLVSSLPSSEFQPSEIPGYCWVEKESTYGGIKQRWLVVESAARKKSDLEKLAQKIVKEYDSTQKKLAKLSKKSFDSSAEANFTIKTIQSTLRWLFQCFQGIHLLVHRGIKQVVNLTEERQLTLKFFPLSCQKYYILSG